MVHKKSCNEDTDLDVGLCFNISCLLITLLHVSKLTLMKYFKSPVKDLRCFKLG